MFGSVAGSNVRSEIDECCYTDQLIDLNHKR